MKLNKYDILFWVTAIVALGIAIYSGVTHWDAPSIVPAIIVVAVFGTFILSVWHMEGIGK
jgi:hypothetical protein